MKPVLSLTCAAALAFTPATVFAVPPTHGAPPAPLSISPNHDTGQPDQSCEDLGNQPGQSINGSGSAFNPDGTAGTRYAGEQDGINNKNTASVSQYDVACLHNQSPQQ
jgi:hypothetical protein